MKNLVFVLILVLVVLVLETGCNQPEVEEPFVYVADEQPYAGDAIEEGGKALQALDAYLQSITTTTSTIVPKVDQNKIDSASVPEYRNGHADVWDDLAYCETRGNWSANTGNGFGGGLQFAHSASWSTWRAFGGEEFSNHPWEASREQQIIVGERVLQSSGWKAWPGCARKMGLN